MPIPPNLTGLFGNVIDGAEGALGDDLAGAYVRGSLAIGDFIPETSDADVFIVTERPVVDRQFAALATMHDEIAALPHFVGWSSFRSFWRSGVRFVVFGVPGLFRSFGCGS